MIQETNILSDLVFNRTYAAEKSDGSKETIDSVLQVTETTINGEIVNSVNLRRVHTWLSIKRKFADWAKDRLSDFQVGSDFIVDSKGSQICESVKSMKLSIDYLVTLDTAKEICMLERNIKGKEARNYFITCEKRLRDIVQQQQLALKDAELQQLTEALQVVETAKKKRSPYWVHLEGHEFRPASEAERLLFKISHLENMITGCEVNIDRYKRELTSFDIEEII